MLQSENVESSSLRSTKENKQGTVNDLSFYTGERGTV
jgi:hypothetical protein